MIFFWSIFDGILTYMLPILISQQGFSKIEMGLILGSSSFAGALFDIVASKYIKIPHFRTLYASLFVLSAALLGLIYLGNTIWIFLLAMAMWGIYWDLFHFANFDFISRAFPEKEHTSAFGILGVFQTLGFIVAPIIAGLLIGDAIDDKPFLFAAAMLCLGFILYVGLYIKSLKQVELPGEGLKRHNWTQEYRLWAEIMKQLLPVLLLTFLVYVIEAFFWTIGPLIAEGGEFGNYGGFLLVAFSFPSLVIGWFVGSIANRFGKKKTALYSVLIGSCLLSAFSLLSNPFHIIVLVVLLSICIGFSYPTLNGAYADYISETIAYEKEIQGVIDLFYNLGWMVGPVAAGILAQQFGNNQSFSILGLFSVMVCCILIFKMPKSIHLKV